MFTSIKPALTKEFVQSRLKDIGHLYGNFENPSRVAICVGIARALSIHLEKTFDTVICAFNESNLDTIRRKSEEWFPNAQVTIPDSQPRDDKPKDQTAAPEYLEIEEKPPEPTKELSEELPTPSLTTPKTGQDVFESITPNKSPSQSNEVTEEDLQLLKLDSETEEPTIVITGRLSTDQTAPALNGLVQSNNPPRLFTREGELFRLSLIPTNQALGTQILKVVSVDQRCLRYELERAIQWKRKGHQGEEVPTAPPNSVLLDILAMPDFPMFPRLNRTTTAPCVVQGGRVIDRTGYDEDTGIFYFKPEPLEIPTSEPTQTNLEKAKELINEWLIDFPFADQSSKTHAMALLILPFVRDLIDGVTPLHFITAPSQRTGKSLLSEILCSVFNPLVSSTTVPEGKDSNDEWRKKITSLLLDQSPHIWFDNIKGLIDAANLEAALTSRTITSRLLGTNQNATLKNDKVWLATGNNAELSSDMTGRTIEIRLDANMENPSERSNFKHRDIRAWTKKHRGELIAAVLTLVRFWLNQGSPKPDAPMLGGFEQWQMVIGGILQAAGIPGFLENRKEMTQRVNEFDAVFHDFINGWFEKFGSSPSRPKDLHGVAKDVDVFESALWAKDEASENKRLGKWLTKNVDRVIVGYKICKTRDKSTGKNAYSLQEIANGNIPLKKCEKSLPPFPPFPPFSPVSSLTPPSDIEPKTSFSSDEKNILYISKPDGEEMGGNGGNGGNDLKTVSYKIEETGEAEIEMGGNRGEALSPQPQLNGGFYGSLNQAIQDLKTSKGFLKDDERFVRERVSELGLNNHHLSPVLIEYTERFKRDGRTQANSWLLDLTIEKDVVGNNLNNGSDVYQALMAGELGVSPSENIKHEMLSSQLTSEILKFAGYSIIDGQFVHDGRVLNNRNLLQRGFSEWVIENAKKIEFIHKIPELKGNDREIKEMRQRNFLEKFGMRFLQLFLRDMGLSLKHSAKVVDRRKVYNYTIDEVKLNRLNEILRARNSTERTDDIPTSKLCVSPSEEIEYKRLSSQLTHNLSSDDVYHLIMSGELMPQDDDDRAPIDSYF